MLTIEPQIALSRLYTIVAVCALAALASGCFYVPPISAPVEEADSPPFVLNVERVRLVDLSREAIVRFEVAQVYDRNPPEEISYQFRYDAAFENRNVSVANPEAPTGRLVPAPDQTLTALTTYSSVATRVDFCQVTAGGDRPSAMRLVLTDPIPVDQRGSASADPLADVNAFVVEVSWRLEFVGACP